MTNADRIAQDLPMLKHLSGCCILASQQVIEERRERESAFSRRVFTLSDFIVADKDAPGVFSVIDIQREFQAWRIVRAMADRDRKEQ